MKSQQIRDTFLSFFESKSHEIVSSAPMVIKNDPTLLFTNAGMNQFKEFFLGNSIPKFSRVTDTQKCLRVSGKHNDLEEVGRDTYHHTMFEMLGNWSFGDYFKKEAINWAWELLTEVFKVDPAKLYVTIFEGDTGENLERDTKAYDLWRQHLPEDRVLNGNKNDNFWEMGDQGPCGPCSEIHVDLRSDNEKAEIPGAQLVNADHPQVVEVWNLVFMQYNRLADGSLKNLPAKHVDTGMGFERLCMVLQGKTSNYDTDVFTPLIREIETITDSKYYTDRETDIAIRVVADHVRAVAFSIADGQLPSNTGAGYVIRRILRRAIRYGFTFLGQKQPFIFKLIGVLKAEMGDAFPELAKQQDLITNVIREEEQSFLRTLDQGLVLLDSIIASLPKGQAGAKAKKISGSKAFELYDTYGFPIDLTALILREKGFDLDMEGFEHELKQQKERSRAASKMETGDWVVVNEKQVEGFVGYDTLEVQVQLIRYRKISTKKEGDQYQLVFDHTPFYPEGGGQVGDNGYLEAKNGDIIHITDTKKENNLIIHYTKELPKNLDETLTAAVNAQQRAKNAANHSATHLLHQALRNILGPHVEQKGSLVNGDALRFDFSHFAKVTSEQLDQIEEFVNARIREHLPLEEQRAVPYAQALGEGAIALFGEKYGDDVRTIRFGKTMELCGGTHVSNTGDIWYFKIISESSVAAGVRRIEAITGEAVMRYFAEQDKQLQSIRNLLKNTQDPLRALENLQEENNSLKTHVDQLLLDKVNTLKSELKNELSDVGGMNFLAREVDLDAGGMKDISFKLGGEVDNLFLFLASRDNGKALLSCYIDKDLAKAKNLNASQIIRDLSKHIQGGGGGQPFFATAGGKNPDGIEKALEGVLKRVKG